jgi:acetyl-CoA decarbonylase/synthase complex subunit gamma
MGEETVLFRHDKKFVNPCAFALEIKDTLSEVEINSKIEEVLASEIERVGQILRIDAIALCNDSHDTGKFEAAAKIIALKAPEIPVIICSENPEAAEVAVKLFAEKKPIVFGANPANADAMANIAKNYKSTLGVTASSASGGGSLDALSSLTEKIKSLGVQDMVIDSGARTAKDILKDNTFIRRAAIKKNFKPLGYPVITFAMREDSLLEALIGTISVAKYSSIIVLSSIEKWKNLALFALRQNLYTDPQVPMQVEQKVYKIGEPSPASPLLITTNFSLTYFIVSGEIENSKVSSYLAVMDCEGLSVLTAWAAGKFTAAKIAQFIKESDIENAISHRELVIPGYVAILSGSIEDKLEGWKITVGPREANGIPAFMRARSG